MKILREFIGTTKLEELFASILNNQIDKILIASYDEDRANATSSKLEGVVK
ncbi:MULTISPECIES: hypothetical protein [Bacillus]|uniref:hypothetical protein n=1 Tax=Bacillus TaxID=1386 RepID=UPI000AF96647|nr:MULTISPECIES: hypothetical protein [Bacillus]